MTPEIPEAAAVLALSIEFGLDEAREGVDWACELVAALPEPSEKLLELAGLVRPHPLDVIGLLRQIPGPIDERRAFRKLLAKFRRVLLTQPSEWLAVTKTLEQMALRGYVPESLSGPCLRLDDARLLAESGVYGTLEEVHSDLIDFLEKESVPTELGKVAATVTRFVESAQPGWIECVLTDISGNVYRFVEKVPVVTTEAFDERTAYPQPVALDCELMDRYTLPDGRTAIAIDTSNPWGLESTEGRTRFLIEE